MTEWVLITMLCMRNCIPQYAEIYSSKNACMAKVTKPESAFSRQTEYCVPLVKEKNT